MKNLILLCLFFWLGEQAIAQQSLMSLPRDARNNPLESGLGGSYAASQTITVTAYNVSQRYQVPSSGLDVNRAYRHFFLLNRDAVDTITVCFGDATGCSDNAVIVRPGYGVVFEPVLFGKAVGKEYVYFKTDLGPADIDVAVW